MPKKPKLKRRLKPALEAKLYLYDEFDHELVEAIRTEARAGERTIIQQIKFMLRAAHRAPALEQ